MKNKSKNWKAGLICIVAMTLLCGIVYPVVMTGISQLFFSDKANGSQVVAVINGKETVIGSKYMGQAWTKPEYLIGRPNTGAPSNQSAVSDAQKATVEERVAWWNEFDPSTIGKEIPADLVTASGSGVDPEISVEAAKFQIARIAEKRNMSESEVEKIIDDNTEGKTFGFLGEERVNVLMVNAALDGLEIK